jgi:beta-lactamase class A
VFRLEAAHRITAFDVTAVQYARLSRTAALAALHHLPGQVNLLALKNGSTQLAINPDQPLAVGSAFKLAVLAALQQQIAARRLSWDQMVTLLARDKSLPSRGTADSANRHDLHHRGCGTLHDLDQR